MTISKYERPFDWDTYSAKEKLDDIVARLNFIIQQEKRRDMRKHYATEDQFAEEFGDAYDDTLKQLWKSCKLDYLNEKNILDSFMNNSNNSKYYKDCISAMNRVIQDELDDILLGDETESIDE